MAHKKKLTVRERGACSIIPRLYPSWKKKSRKNDYVTKEDSAARELLNQGYEITSIFLFSYVREVKQRRRKAFMLER